MVSAVSMRHVAVEDGDVAVEAVEEGPGLHHRVPGAQLLVLEGELDAVVGVLHGVDHLVATHPDHQDDVVDLRGHGRLDAVDHHGLAVHRMEDLGQVGAHPPALAGGQDHGLGGPGAHCALAPAAAAKLATAASRSLEGVEHPVEAGHGEHHLHPRLEPAQPDVARPDADPLEQLDQGGQPGAVDDLDVGQVDDEVVAPRGQQAGRSDSVSRSAWAASRSPLTTTTATPSSFSVVTSTWPQHTRRRPGRLAGAVRPSIEVVGVERPPTCWTRGTPAGGRGSTPIRLAGDARRDLRGRVPCRATPPVRSDPSCGRRGVDRA